MPGPAKPADSDCVSHLGSVTSLSSLTLHGERHLPESRFPHLRNGVTVLGTSLQSEPQHRHRAGHTGLSSRAQGQLRPVRPSSQVHAGQLEIGRWECLCHRNELTPQIKGSGFLPCPEGLLPAHGSIQQQSKIVAALLTQNSAKGKGKSGCRVTLGTAHCTGCWETLGREGEKMWQLGAGREPGGHTCPLCHPSAAVSVTEWKPEKGRSGIRTLGE